MSSRFVTFLIEHREDRAMRAALRRGLGKAIGDPVMYPYVVPFLYDQKDAWRYFIVASLFGLHPKHRADVNFGAALGKLERNESLKKRFTWLLDAAVEELPMRLKTMLSQLRAKNIPFDYEMLFKDLRDWDHPDRFVQLRWAKGFYQIKDEQLIKE